MEGVLAGLSMMWAVIAVGVVLGLTGALGPGAADVLTRFVYWVACPAIVFVTIAKTDVRAMLGPAFAVEAISAPLTALTYAGIAALVMKAKGSELVVGAMCSALSNAAYLGLAMSSYILGDATHAIPVLIFQLGLLTPTFFVLTDLFSGRRKPSAAGTLRLVATNPIMLAALFGAVVSLSGSSLPKVVLDPVEVLAGAAVPCILVAFGISLLERGKNSMKEAAPAIGLASACKLLLQPALAYLAGRFIFGLGGLELFAVTMMGGLPTAQNAYVAAFRAQAGLGIARGTVLATTVFLTPTLLAISALLT